MDGSRTVMKVHHLFVTSVNFQVYKENKTITLGRKKKSVSQR